MKPVNLTDPDLYLGTVVEVAPASLVINLPFAAAASLRRLEGRLRLGGLTGDFVCVDAEGWVVLGRIDEIRLPERERAMVDPRNRLEEGDDPYPIGRVVLLASVHVRSGEVRAGLERPVRLGARVFLAPPAIVQAACESIGDQDDGPLLTIGAQPLAQDIPLGVDHVP